MASDVEARRARFAERGGVVPAEGESRALLEAILASGELLPELLLADVSALPALAADPWLQRPKPPRLIAAAVEEGTRGATDFRFARASRSPDWMQAMGSFKLSRPSRRGGQRTWWSPAAA